jgi:hypothetical protein
MWLPKASRIELDGLEHGQHYDIEIAFCAGGDELYDYFPFNAWVRPATGPGEIIEFCAAHEDHVVHLAGLRAENGTIALEFSCDLGSVPARAGIGPDERELALVLTSVEARPRSDERNETARLGPASAGAPRPVFVIGAYRSGTSIMTWAIGQHPDIFALDETGWIHSGLVSLSACFELACDRAGSAAETYGIDSRHFLRGFAQYLDRFHHSISRQRSERILFTRLAGKSRRFDPRIQLQRAPGAPKSRWVDGTPENAVAGRLIADVYPEAQFIVMVRHPLEVIRSLLHFDRAGGRAYALDEALATWSRMTALAIDTASYVGPRRAQVVTYDRLSDPRSLMRGVLRFLDEPHFEPAAAAFDVRLNSSRVEDEAMPASEGPETARAIANYELIRAGKLPELSAFHVPGLYTYDDYIKAYCNDVRQALQGRPASGHHS